MPATLEAPETEAAEAVQAAPAASAPGGLKAWLPLIISVIAMPVLAFATTKFVLQPQLERALIAKAGQEASKESTDTAAHGSKEGGKGNLKNKVTVPLSKMLVNVSGTLGTRYLMTSITLVGSTPEFKTKVEENKDQLMDLATGTLSTKTIADLEKPGARNVIRTELITVFNNALGGSAVQEIYITELAIQ